MITFDMLTQTYTAVVQDWDDGQYITLGWWDSRTDAETAVSQHEALAPI